MRIYYDDSPAAKPRAGVLFKVVEHGGVKLTVLFDADGNIDRNVLAAALEEAQARVEALPARYGGDANR